MFLAVGKTAAAADGLLQQASDVDSRTPAGVADRAGKDTLEDSNLLEAPAGVTVCSAGTTAPRRSAQTCLLDELFHG